MSQAELKAALHARIETMDKIYLALCERVLLVLELDELSADLDAGFDADRRAGMLTGDKVQNAVAQARASQLGEPAPTLFFWLTAR